MPLRPSTKTFGDLFLDIKRIFGDEAGVQLDVTDVTRWANTAQQEIVTSNKALKAKSTTPAVIGQSAYTFPDFNIQQIEAIHYNNSFVENVPFAQAETTIISNDPNKLATGSPVLWYEWDGEFTFWPTPDSAGTITLYYTEYADPLTGDTTQKFDLPDKFYAAILDYCLSKAYEMDEDLNASQMAEQRFRAALEAQMEDERQSQHRVYPVIQDVVSEAYSYGTGWYY